ncbi:MAG: VWA-like domain-containing protein [Lachnospiraceae bacterium]|nr:VWA-like domain-containing protein [Lachnospiraceae bacterium]
MDNSEAAKRIIDTALKKVKEDSYRLVYAVNIFKPVPFKEKKRSMIGTDGEHLFFDPERVIQSYKYNGIKWIREEIFHVIMHGILGHFERTKEFSHPRLAGYVMDLEIEEIMEELGMNQIFNAFPRPDWYRTVGLSLYNRALMDKTLYEQVSRTGKMRTFDDHSLWWDRNETKNGSETDLQNNGGIREELCKKWAEARKYVLGSSKESHADGKRVIEELQKDSVGFRGRGRGPGQTEKLTKAEGEVYSFTEVLSRFIKNRMVSKSQPDSFDPMLYEYGLSLYGDVPLMEPLEETEEKRIENLCIAIDTSASCFDKVGIFLKQVTGIFEEIAGEFSFGKIYLIQCDDEVRNVRKFEDMGELSGIRDTMLFEGYGGTDFCPVFKWIDQNLTAKNEEVDCLLYFSDANGEFPKKNCGFPVIFVLPDEQCREIYGIPDWISAVRMDSDRGKRGLSYEQC